LQQARLQPAACTHTPSLLSSCTSTPACAHPHEHSCTIAHALFLFLFVHSHSLPLFTPAPAPAPAPTPTPTLLRNLSLTLSLHIQLRLPLSATRMGSTHLVTVNNIRAAAMSGRGGPTTVRAPYAVPPRTSSAPPSSIEYSALTDPVLYGALAACFTHMLFLSLSASGAMCILCLRSRIHSPIDQLTHSLACSAAHSCPPSLTYFSTHAHTLSHSRTCAAGFINRREKFEHLLKQGLVNERGEVCPTRSCCGCACACVRVRVRVCVRVRMCGMRVRTRVSHTASHVLTCSHRPCAITKPRSCHLAYEASATASSDDVSVSWTGSRLPSSPMLFMKQK
jgi:hypothetical protein